MKSLFSKFLIAVMLILACLSTYAVAGSHVSQKALARDAAERIADLPSPTRTADPE